MHRILICLAIGCLCTTVTGCYLVQLAAGQQDVMSRSVPIDDLIADPVTAQPTRERLELAREARQFAVVALALPDGRSYRRYADLGRPYAVWNVVAAEEFSTEPRRWCYPVAGCVSYRGYFEETRARAAARRLAARGDDVTVGGVATYSTLGRFPDPLFNTMLGWQDARLVGTIFHELAHERLYVPGDSEFNEAFASVVEAEGVRRWFAARGQDAALEAFRATQAREAGFATLLRETRDRLSALYASGRPVDEMRIEKQREFGRLKSAYSRLKAGWNGYSGYDLWFARVLNNAHLVAVATYHDCVPGLRRELDAAGSLPAFYLRAGALAKLPGSRRHAAVCTDE